VQPLDCYQNERRQGESLTKNHSHSRRRRICFTTTMLLLKSAFYSNHITRTGPTAISFLKSKALLNTNWEK